MKKKFNKKRETFVDQEESISTRSKLKHQKVKYKKWVEDDEDNFDISYVRERKKWQEE